MTLDQTIVRFSEKIINKYFSEYVLDYFITPFTPTEDFGKGGFGNSLIYQIFSTEHTLLCVIKAETIDSVLAPYTSLISPTSILLRQISLPQTELILPIDAENVSVDGTLLRLLAIPAAVGHPMTTELLAVAKNKQTLPFFLETVRAIMQALGSLNAFSLCYSPKLSPHLEQAEDDTINVFLLYLEEHPEWFPFHASLFKERFAHIFAEAHTVPFLIGFVHGDCNLTNIFFDPQNKKISLIDSLTLFHSIDPQGKPLGNIAREFIYARLSFQLYGTYYGMSQANLLAIDATILQAYPLKIPLQQQLLYTLHYWMGYIIIIYKTLKKMPLLEKDLKYLLNYCVNQLKNAL